MSKTYNFYCDESSHLLKDGHPYMLIAYVSVAYPQIKQHKAYIKLLKARHSFKGEIKWSNVSKYKYKFYADVIDYFFATDLMFRAVIVSKDQIDETRKDYSYQDFYYRMYYQLLYHKMDFKSVYNIYLDIKDTNSQNKLKKLSEILQHQLTIRNIQFIRSNESYLLQMADLLVGAINYHIRGLNKVIAKNKLISKIQSHSKISLEKSTPKSANKFNLFFIDLK